MMCFYLLRRAAEDFGSDFSDVDSEGTEVASDQEDPEDILADSAIPTAALEGVDLQTKLDMLRKQSMDSCVQTEAEVGVLI